MNPSYKFQIRFIGHLVLDHKINTIKFIRYWLGCGLKEAKDLVEAHFLPAQYIGPIHRGLTMVVTPVQLAKFYYLMVSNYDFTSGYDECKQIPLWKVMQAHTIEPVDTSGLVDVTKFDREAA